MFLLQCKNKVARIKSQQKYRTWGPESIIKRQIYEILEQKNKEMVQEKKLPISQSLGREYTWRRGNKMGKIL